MSSWIPTDASLLALAHNTALYDDCKYDDALDDLKETIQRVHREAMIEGMSLALEHIQIFDTVSRDAIRADIDRLRSEGMEK